MNDLTLPLAAIRDEAFSFCEVVVFAADAVFAYAACTAAYLRSAVIRKAVRTIKKSNIRKQPVFRHIFTA